MEYMLTNFGVDSSSRFTFREQTESTDRQTDTQTKSNAQLMMLLMPQLLSA